MSVCSFDSNVLLIWWISQPPKKKAGSSGGGKAGAKGKKASSVSGFDSEEPTEPEMSVRNLCTLHGNFLNVWKMWQW